MNSIIVVLLLIGIWYVAQVVVWLCAERNIFWTIVKEGYAVAIMRNGVFHKMLLRYTGHRFKGSDYHEGDSLDAYEIEPEEKKVILDHSVSYLVGVLFPIHGIAWVGIPPFFGVHKYMFEWLDDRFEPREEEVSWILAKTYVYGLILEKIELEGGIPYTIRLLITLRVTNPAKALFRVHRWLDTSLERIYGWARNEFSNLSADDFFIASDGRAGEKLVQALERITTAAKSQLAPFGVSVDVLQINEVDPNDGELRAIIIKKEVAKQEALAAIETAKGKAAAIGIINEAAEKMSEKALLLEGFEALKKAGANVSLIGKDINLPLMLQIPTAPKKNDGSSGS